MAIEKRYFWQRFLSFESVSKFLDNLRIYYKNSRSLESLETLMIIIDYFK